MIFAYKIMQFLDKKFERFNKTFKKYVIRI